MEIEKIFEIIKGFYKNPLNIKSAFFRAIILLPLFIFPESLGLLILSLYVLGGFATYSFEQFIEEVLSKTSYNFGGYINEGSFLELFIHSVGILLILVVLYLILKLIINVKINFEITLILFSIVILGLSSLEYHSQIILEDLGFTVEVVCIFALIQLILFNTFIYIADLKIKRKQIRKALISFICSIILGYLISGLLWPLLFRNYKPNLDYSSSTNTFCYSSAKRKVI